MTFAARFAFHRRQRRCPSGWAVSPFGEVRYGSWSVSSRAISRLQAAACTCSLASATLIKIGVLFAQIPGSESLGPLVGEGLALPREPIGLPYQRHRREELYESV